MTKLRLELWEQQYVERDAREREGNLRKREVVVSGLDDGLVLSHMYGMCM